MVSAAGAAAAASPLRRVRPGAAGFTGPGAPRGGRRVGGWGGRAGAAGLGGLRRPGAGAPARVSALAHSPRAPAPRGRPRGAGRGPTAAGRAGERLRGEFSRRGSPGIPFSRLKGSPPWLPLLSLLVAPDSPAEAELGRKGWRGE